MKPALARSLGVCISMPRWYRYARPAGVSVLLILATVLAGILPAQAKRLSSTQGSGPAVFSGVVYHNGHSRSLLHAAENSTADVLHNSTWSQSRRSLQAENSSAGAPGSSTVCGRACKAPHKPLTPVSSTDIAVFVVAGFVLFIAAGAGMGGGPVLVPVYLTLGAFSNQAAVALSNSTILAGSIANVLCNARRRHPFKDKPLVDWDLILLMQPPTLLGAIAGSYINKLLPSWISHLLLALVLTLMTVRVLQRASIVYRRETTSKHSTHAAAPAAPLSAGAEPASPVLAPPPAAAAALGRLSPGLQSPGSKLAAKLQTKQHTCLVSEDGRGVGRSSSSGSSFGRTVCGAGAAGSSSPPNTGAATAALAAGKSGSRISFAGDDGVVHLLALKKTAAAAAAAAGNGACTVPRSSCSSSRISNDGSDGSSALAYAPPSHTRKSSWELQDDDWDADWEVWGAIEATQPAGGSCSPHSSRRATGYQSQCAAAGSAGAAAGGLATDAAGSGRCTAGSSGGGSSSVARERDSQAGLLQVGRTSSSSSRGVPLQLPHTGQQVPPEMAAQSAELQALLRAESAQFPLVPAVLCCALFAAVLLTSLLSKLAGCGSLGYWLVQLAVAPPLGAIFWYSRRRVLRSVAHKRAHGYDFHGDIRWTSKNSVLFPAICSLSGLIAGMFGLGGAVVLTPLMLELGVQPQVTAATTQTMLLLTSAASTITYAQMGDIPWDYCAVLLPVAFAATLAGQVALDVLIKRLGRSSLVVMVLAVFFVVACGLTYYVAVESLKVAAADVVAASVPGRICS